MFRSPFRTPFGRGIQTKKIAEGGSEAAVGVAAEAAGQKIAIGGAEVSLSVAAEGGGVKIVHLGGAETTIYITTEAGGTKIARSPPAEAEVSTIVDGGGEKIAEGGSEASVAIATEGGGVKQDFSVYVYIATEGDGVKTGIGGAEAAVEITTETTGIKIAEGGSEAAVGVSTEAGGVKRAVSGAETGIAVSSEGGGIKRAVGGAETAVQIEAAGAGTKTAAGGSGAVILVETTGGGGVYSSGGSETAVGIAASGGGIKVAQGGDEAIVVIGSTGGGYRKPEAPPVSPYIILDRVTETPLAWLDAALVSPVEIDDLTTGEMRLEIQYPITGPDAGKITKGRKIATTDIDGAWQVYEITNTSTVVNSQGMYIKASCEHEFYELQTEKFISLNFTENTAIYALEQILYGTRWQAGTVEPAGTRTVQMPDHNPLQALSRVASVWDGELRFRVEVEANTITGRYVDLLVRRGAITGQRFEFGHNITSARVDIDTSSLLTAMHGRGQGEDIGEGTDEAERLTFEGYEWKISEGDPADKPLGQDWIGDEAARKLYGKPDGTGGRKHIFGLYESQAKTPETLIWETWHQIQKRNRPRVTADFAIADLEQIKVVDIATGELVALDHEKARLGDTCYMIVRRDDLRIELEARIIRIERHRKDPAQTRITMGDPAPVGTDLYQELRQKARLQEARQAVHDRAALFQPGTGDYDYELDIGEKRIRIVGQTYFYWDGAGFYAIKPTDLNKYWRYDQNGLRYTENGGVSWKHRFGIDELVVGSGAKFTGDIEVGSSESGNIAGISGDGSAAGSVRFWAGHADKTQAPYRVTQDGSLYASKATITGTINATGGTFSGDITATGTIKGGTLDGATISGGSISIGGDYGTNFRVSSSGSFYSAGGNFYVPYDGDGVFNDYSGVARWKLDNYDYLYQSSTNFRIYFSGNEKFSVNNSGSITVFGDATINGDLTVKSYGGNPLVRGGSYGYLKFLQQSSGGIQSRNASDSAYAKMQASEFELQSGREFKENIALPNISALDVVLNVPVYEYTLKHKEQQKGIPAGRYKHIGLIAEDLPDILRSDHQEDELISLGDVVGILWKAVQELNSKMAR